MKTGAGPRQALPNDAEAELQCFIKKFDPKNQEFIRAVRRTLQKRLHDANELVYDNYNFFVIGYSYSERPSDAILSLVADHKGVRIAFPYICTRLPDPHKMLQGSGSKNRFIRINSAEELKRPELDALIQAAVDLSAAPPSSAKGKLIIRYVSAKQRPRRTSK